MGHRAHYAVRRNGEVRLYYAHWGARTVPEDLFFGPAHAEGFVRRLERGRVWLDDVWAEGGAAIDHDDRVVAFFGGDTDEDLIEAWLQLMRALWPGWTVRWVDGMTDLAMVMDVDPKIVRGATAGHRFAPQPLPSQIPLADAAPRIWTALSRAEARKDVLLAHARQTLGGLPPEPVYGEDLSHQPQFLARVPASWPGPVAAEAAFAFAQAVATRDSTAAELGTRAFTAAIDAEEAALALDLLAARAAVGPGNESDLEVARGVMWLSEQHVDVERVLERAWPRWGKALDGASTAEELLERLRETV